MPWWARLLIGAAVYAAIIGALILFCERAPLMKDDEEENGP